MLRKRVVRGLLSFAAWFAVIEPRTTAHAHQAGRPTQRPKRCKNTHSLRFEPGQLMAWSRWIPAGLHLGRAGAVHGKSIADILSEA
jgi:hypothetical protein